MAHELAKSIAYAVFDAIEAASLQHKSITLTAVEDVVESVLGRANAGDRAPGTLATSPDTQRDLYDLETLRKFFTAPDDVKNPNYIFTAPWTFSSPYTTTIGSDTHTIVINPK